jgi:hypothetical protein
VNLGRNGDGPAITVIFYETGKDMMRLLILAELDFSIRSTWIARLSFDFIGRMLAQPILPDRALRCDQPAHAGGLTLDLYLPGSHFGRPTTRDRAHKFQCKLSAANGTTLALFYCRKTINAK